MPLSFSRREVLEAGVVGAGMLMMPGVALAARRVEASGPKRVLRLAHLTDPHIQPELKGGEGVAACLTHLMAQKDRPELVLSGGDHVMDSFSQENGRASQLWNLWKTVWKDHCTLPVRSCIGNHDIWGWDKAGSKTTGTEPNWGKKRAVEELGIPAPYYSFSQAGWKIIVLDTVQPMGEKDYQGGLDDAQFEWLGGELKAAGKTPVLVLSHIPILHASMLLVKDDGKARQTSRGKVCMDAIRITSLFEKYPCVKACLSGHIHVQERIDFQGVAYLCNGAVCGNWWKANKNDGTPHVNRAAEGYALVDLFEDGTLACGYRTYGWKAVE